MIQDSLKTAARFGRKLGKVSDRIASTLGVEEQVDRFHSGVEWVPGVKQLKTAVKALAADLLADELPLYKEEEGPHEVGGYHHSYHDSARGREVPVTVYYPKEPQEESPVVVLSHGLGGNCATYRYLGKHLASHGYTVLQPTHVGSNTAAFLTKTPIWSFTQEELVERSEDVSFCLDLLEKGGLPKEICENVDLEKVALAGHSFGALTTTAMAGMVTNDENGKPIEMKDDRIDAFIAMSPYGDALPTKVLGMDIETYDQIEQPILFMNGEQDQLFTLGKGAKVHSLPYQEASSEDKYQVVVGGAYHVSFAQVVGLADPDTVDITKSTSVAFLDAHLCGQAEAKSYLADDLARVARSRDSLAYVGS